MPDDETSHCVLVGRGPVVFGVEFGEGVVTWHVVVESAVLVEEVVFGDEPGVEVAVS